MKSMDHIDEKILELFVLEAQDVTNKRAKIEQHLKECEGCASLYEEISEYYKEVEQLSEAQDRSSRLPVSKRWFPAAYEPDRTAISKYDKSIPVRIGRFIARYPIASSSFGLAAAVVMALMLFSPKKIITDTNPNYARAKDEFLIVYNKNGEELWRKHIGLWYDWEKLLEQGLEPNDYVQIIDVDGDGKREVLSIYGFLPDSTNKHTIFCNNADGSEKWKYTIHRNMTFGNETFSDDYSFHSIESGDFDNNGKIEVIATVLANLFYPTTILRFDASTGKLLEEYWHSGNLFTMKHRDIEDDRNEEIFISGCNNGYDLACLSVFDSRNILGHSPAPPAYTPIGIPNGSEKYYILFPRTDIKAFTDFKRNVSKSLYFTKEGLLRVYVSEQFPANLSYTLFYYFDSTMKCVRVDADDRYIIFHRQLEAEGKLTRKVDYEYFEDLRRQVQYWDGEKFVNYPTMNKKYIATTNPKHLP